MNAWRKQPRTAETARPVPRLLAALAASVVLSAGLAGCGTMAKGPAPKKLAKAEVDPKYGVKPSPRVYQPGEAVPKGGGREMVGKPYTVAGKRYTPRVDRDYEKIGLASWYGDAFHGRYTANGEIYDANSLSAAHPTMPLPSYARVTSMTTGRSVMVRVNDRGPYHGNRVMDVSRRTADMLGIRRAGVSKVKVEYVGPAPTDGDDTRMLMASYRGPADPGPSLPETMIASAESGFGLPGLARSVVGIAGFGKDAPSKAPAARTAPAPVLVAAAETAPAAAAAPASAPSFAAVAAVMPTPRPSQVEEMYVTVAAADPADAWFAASPVQVAALQAPQAGLAAAAAAGFTPASFKVGAQPAAYQAVQATYSPTDSLIAPLPVAAPSRSSYAADRIDAAYAAVDGFDSGVALNDLAAGLAKRAHPGVTDAPEPSVAAPSVATVDVGIFSNGDNAERIARALSGVGTVSVEDVTVGGKPMKRVRLATLAEGLTAGDAVAAAERAGARGARVLAR